MHCPECDVEVTQVSSETHFEWFLKPEYAGVVGLPVGPQFGRPVPIYQTHTFQPCGCTSREFVKA